MRVVGLHADVLVCTSALLADDLHDRARCGCATADGAEAFVIDSPVLPEELESLPGAARAGRLAVHRAAGDARRLGPPARPARVPGRGARRRRDDGRAPDRRARRRGARAARVRRRSTTSSGRARSALGQLQALPVPGQARGRRAASSSCIRPRATSPDGMAIWIPWAKVLVCGDFLSPVEIPMLSRGRLALGLPRDARAPARRSSSRPTTSCPGTARCSTPSARRRSCARTSPTSRRSSCRWRGARPSSAGSTPRTSSGSRRPRARAA